jgi:adhesin YadB/C
MVNDDTATTAADHAYTDGQVTAEATARIAGDAATLSSANAHSGAAVLAESVTRAAGDAATLTSANTYTDAEKTRAMAAEALKANLAGGNTFTGGSQVLAPSAGAYASLNVPNSTTAPTTPGVGDIWLVNLDPHLHFRDMNNATQMLAFFSDITTANSNTLASARTYTDTSVATEAAARVAGDAATLSSANAHADAGDAATLSSADAHADTAVMAESVARAAGDAATLTSANTYTDAEKTRAMAAEALKANLAGIGTLSRSLRFVERAQQHDRSYDARSGRHLVGQPGSALAFPRHEQCHANAGLHLGRHRGQQYDDHSVEQ